jgi:hypothetical protein
MLGRRKTMKEACEAIEKMHIGADQVKEVKA